MHCPRCHRELPDPPPPFCGGCGAPLRLREEPPPARLDTPLPLDRRHGDRGHADRGQAPGHRHEDAPTIAAPGEAALGPRPLPEPHVHAPGAERAALERSHWDLGRPAAAPTPGRAPGAPAPAAPAPAAAQTFAGVAAPAPAGVAPEPAFAEPDALLAPAADDGSELPDPDVDALEIHLRRPPTWRRVAAAALDAAPFAAGGIGLARTFVREAAVGLPAPPTGIDGLVDLVVRERAIVVPVLAASALAFLVYATLAHALAGATLGKRLLRLRVAGPDGERPSLARSAARSALVVLSLALLGMGLLLALFSRSGRALHDLLARTWVVEARADP